MRISPDINRGPAVAALWTRGILSFRQGTLYSRATSVLGRDASDLDELRRGHHNASLVESSVFDLLVQADRASLIALNSTALALSGSLLLADRIPVLKQPIHDRVALHLMAHLPRVL